MNQTNLKRTIGLISATSIGLGAMLGAGIFVFPGLAGGQAGFAAILSFLIGGVIALAVAACTAELATAMPSSGGGYFFISRTFGNFLGTVTGIAQWIGLVFACAFYLASFGEYALTILENLNIQWNSSEKLFSFFFTLMLLMINILGTKKVGQLQNAMVILLTVLLVLMFTYGLFDYLEIEEKPIAFTAIAPNGISSIFGTTALIFTAYLGFVQIANIGAEVKNPDKNLPRSLIWSVVIAMGLYVFIMFSCVVTFPQEELRKFGETATIEVARKMLGNTGALIVLCGGLLAALSSANATVISASRSVYAVSKDKLISERASKINERFGTPHVALIVTALLIAVILIRSKIEIFAEVASFLHLIIYAGICLSVLKLRIHPPKWYVPTFRVPIAKVIAGSAALSCIGLMCFMQSLSILISLGILILIVAYYFIHVRKKEISFPAPNPPHVDLPFINPDILIPVDISEEKKDLPSTILKIIPRAEMWLLGYKETPEQTESEQSEKKYKKEGEEKFERIKTQMEEDDFSFDSKLIFGNKIVSQIKQLIDKNEFQIILSLKPYSASSQVVVPIYHPSQISTRLSTFFRNLKSRNQLKIKVILFEEDSNDPSNETELKKALKSLFSSVDINTQDYDVVRKKELSHQELIREVSANYAQAEDLIIWPEAEEQKRKELLELIFKPGSKEIKSPIIMLLNDAVETEN